MILKFNQICQKTVLFACIANVLYKSHTVITNLNMSENITKNKFIGLDPRKISKNNNVWQNV